MTEQILFGLFALVTCGGAIAVVISQNVVRMAFWLIISLGSTAGLFFLLHARLCGRDPTAGLCRGYAGAVNLWCDVDRQRSVSSDFLFAGFVVRVGHCRRILTGNDPLDRRRRRLGDRGNTS